MLDRRHFLMAAAAFIAPASKSFAQNNFGRFVGEFEARFNPDGRTATLLRELAFIDPDGGRWTAPSGIVVDGASIPWPLWSIVGSPYTGNYRRASVIHDRYCDRREKTWQGTHYIFYLASRVDGISELYAKLLYGGVLSFGPRWEINRDDGQIKNTTPQLKEEEFEQLKVWILDENPTLQEINRRIVG